MARRPKTEGTEDRREQIIDAALRVFARKGFARATNKDIAREAGITPGLIYYYFADKEALLQAVIESRSPLRLFEQLEPAQWDAPPPEFLRSILLQALDVIESEQVISLIRTVLSELLHGEEIPLLPGLFLPRIIDVLQRYLRLQQAKGALRPEMSIEETAQVLLSAMMGLVMRRQVLRDASVLRYSHEELVSLVLKALLPGLLPSDG
ncbi:MAG: TetR/AcrR family transcriptional regulator [Thermogemmatispora sp.]|uniref:TetR/AcrR family transcriptional regulator n=1 Tax=Thermogemmatispora TaxID=768669 RepID=UPI00124DD034|nr:MULTISPECIES: TetR/AcrR family transcriptional regulator [Thermogemmatispora]MBE3565927.1 TetR/AcrR family transcriptional regulator [Thermogemmatispora sp.]GER84045.1 TetR family transcriptional regulator [Thermogemmatispora aurantia]